MIIDFREIPQANKGGNYQDLFEQFACSFLQDRGFDIIRRPDRGPDGKKDIIVKEKRNGIAGNTNIQWLVSCKHFAHSNKSVRDVDEPDISDRVKKFNCSGFIGFYSTIPSSTLSDKLHSLQSLDNHFEYLIYDNSRIERELLTSNQCFSILASYFPNSYEKYRKLKLPKVVEHKDFFNAEGQYELIKTALIVLEIDRLEEEFSLSTWDDKKVILDKLFKFSKHSNEKIANSIFNFMYSISLETRINKDKDFSTINSLVYTFFPSSDDFNSEKLIENGKQCIFTGYNIIYDALIWLGNLKTAINGLLIWKYVYRISITHKQQILIDEVIKYYQILEGTLTRPERDDLENAQQLVKLFKEDLNRPSLDYPDMPENLYKLVIQQR